MINAIKTKCTQKTLSMENQIKAYELCAINTKKVIIITLLHEYYRILISNQPNNQFEKKIKYVSRSFWDFVRMTDFVRTFSDIDRRKMVPKSNGDDEISCFRGHFHVEIIEE